MSLPVTRLLCAPKHKGGCITLREEAVVMESRVSVTMTFEAGRFREACVQVLNHCGTWG